MAVGDIARGFTLAGILDEESKARGRWPILEVDPHELADHPANAAYSMDEAGIVRLADSIRREGLTDIPLARRLPDGSLQLLSGHRRKAAYLRLCREDPSFAVMPVRVLEGVGDDEAVAMLHAANYFTRELNLAERAAATLALEPEVARRRRIDPGLKGVRTSKIKAELIREQTGREVSDRTIRLHENLARMVERDLAKCWQKAALNGEIADQDIRYLAAMSRDDQHRVKELRDSGRLTKKETTKLIKEVTARGLRPKPEPRTANELFAVALKALRESAKAKGCVDPRMLAHAEECIAAIKARRQ